MSKWEMFAGFMCVMVLVAVAGCLIRNDIAALKEKVDRLLNKL